MYMWARFALLGAALTAARPHESPHDRAVRLVAQMTLAEKVRLCSGDGNTSTYVGTVKGIPRLDIPDLRMNDGPEGFRAQKPYLGTSTQWPSGLTVARAWDRQLMGRWGGALGAEFAGKGADVLFGPGANVARIANGGRSFEYVSGEDPYLGHQLIQPLVASIQQQGVIANVKHFLHNDQEGKRDASAPFPGNRGDRHSTSAVLDERTRMEIYFPPFEGAVQAGVLSVMCANNLANVSGNVSGDGASEYACMNGMLINRLLKGSAGFQGFVCSDYDGTRATVDAALGGLDIALPGPGKPFGHTQHPDYFGTMLMAAVAAGEVPESTVTDKAVRVVYAMAASGQLDRPARKGWLGANVTSAAHYALARELAAAGSVLLKNEGGLLPLPLGKTLRVAVIGGAAAGAGAIYGGTGSGSVTGASPTSILDGVRESLAASGAPPVLYADGGDAAAAAKLAAAADIALVVIGSTSGEGHDRDGLSLNQSALVAVIGAAQPRTVVITINPGPYTTEWASHAQAILDLGLPGEMEGHAAADLLFGKVAPSGKLPHSLPNRLNEVRMSGAQYPGVPPDNSTGQACGFVPHDVQRFPPCRPTLAMHSEKLEVGYRWYHAHGVEPAFPFGHGLSYTGWEYSKLTVSGRRVTAEVRNSGGADAAEVVQLYVSYPASAAEPPKQLRGFVKLELAAGESGVAAFELSDRWLSTWSAERGEWVLARGTFGVWAGSSSADLRLAGTMQV